MSVTARPAANAAPARLKIRQNINALSPAQLADLRRAIKQAMELNDKRGFEYFAGWHGVPLGWCQHHDALFLPWHRAYLYWLELALQSQVAGRDAALVGLEHGGHDPGRVHRAAGGRRRQRAGRRGGDQGVRRGAQGRLADAHLAGTRA